MDPERSQVARRTRQGLLQAFGMAADDASERVLPVENLRALLDFTLERGYLEAISEVPEFPKPNFDPQSMAWMRLLRLPIHPAEAEEYDLLSRWQNVLSTLHAWGHRLVFLLLRNGGETCIYLGAGSRGGRMDPATATRQLWQATVGQMPGIELRDVGNLEERQRIELPLERLRAAGTVTGLPSPRKTRGSDMLQTLDQIAFGIRDQSKHEYNYALMVVTDPVPDYRIAQTIHAFRALGSELHTAVKQAVSSSKNVVDSRGWEFSPEALASTLLMGFIPGTMALEGLAKAAPGLAAARGVADAAARYSPLKYKSSHQETESHSVSSEQLDKLAQYCEYVTDRHVVRLQQGRNLGFWGTGTYVLAETETAVHTLAGMLRSVYSGEESYLEPIRVHLFHPRSGADEWIKRFEQVPLPASPDSVEQDAEGWHHPLGSMYEGVATPLNTEELSITTSLPRRDVPGLRFVRNAVRFANNPPPVEEGENTLTLGQVLDTGVSLSLDYALNVNALVRHALVTGVTGSGKSTTCRRLIREVGSRGIPILVIEPAKDEYVRWAIDYNEKVPEAQRIKVYMPGGSEYYDGVEVESLRLNPFQPAQVGDRVDLASRAERFCAVLTASLPMADVLPLLLEESINALLKNQIDVNFADGDVPAPEAYPRLEQATAIARRIIEARGYEQRVRDNLIAAVETRIQALSRGRRGRVLNTAVSTPFADLFERPAVINLSQISDDRDKALLMALLVIALFEYRVSRYRADPDLKRRADDNQLCHLTIIEEAHRLLTNPQTDYAGIGNPQMVVSGMFSEMLSEIRAYGQGLLVVDQVPARLIPDAIKNTNLKIVHRLVARDDRDAMASSMALRPDQENIIAALQRGEAIVCGDLDDAASWVKVEKAF